jgi:hypothetical protein
LLCVNVHPAQLEDAEWAPILTDPGLQKERVSLCFQSDGNRSYQNDWEREEKKDASDDKVNQPSDCTGK